MAQTARKESPPSDRPLRLRCEVRSEDRAAVRRIVQSSGFFSPAEVDVAVELVDERLAKGPQSGYHFVFAEADPANAVHAEAGEKGGQAPSLSANNCNQLEMVREPVPVFQPSLATVGYACYGPISCTLASFDLYWIAVDATYRGTGVGRLLLEQAERQIAAAGGRRVYIETSNRPKYVPTRGFYTRCGYHLEAVLAEFYGPGDDKAIYVKALG